MNDVQRINPPPEIDCLDGLQSLSISSPVSTPRSEEVENKSSSFSFSTADHYQNVKTPTQHPLKLKIIDDSPRLNSISFQREFEFKPSYPSSKSFFPSMRSDSDYESNHNRTSDNIRDYYTPFAVARKQQQKLPEKKKEKIVLLITILITIGMILIDHLVVVKISIGAHHNPNHNKLFIYVMGHQN